TAPTAAPTAAISAATSPIAAKIGATCARIGWTGAPGTSSRDGARAGGARRRPPRPNGSPRPPDPRRARRRGPAGDGRPTRHLLPLRQADRELCAHRRLGPALLHPLPALARRRLAGHADGVLGRRFGCLLRRRRPVLARDRPADPGPAGERLAAR